MIRQCAWCDRFLGEKAPWDNPAVTHGICSEYRAQILRQGIEEEEKL